MLAVVDDFSRECLALVADTSLSGLRVTRELTELIKHRGKPMQNKFVESFNGSFRDECLNETLFTTLKEARAKIKECRDDDNQQRPHSSLGNLTPNEYARRMTLHKLAA